MSSCLLSDGPQLWLGVRTEDGPLLQDANSLLCGIQERGGEVRHILPPLHGTHAAEGRETGQAVPHGDPVHPAEKPLSSLPAFQRARALPQQYLPGEHTPERRLSRNAERGSLTPPPKFLKVVSFDAATTVDEFQCGLNQDAGTRRTGLSGFSLYSDDPTGQDLEHCLHGDTKVLHH